MILSHDQDLQNLINKLVSLFIQDIHAIIIQHIYEFNFDVAECMKSGEIEK